MPDQDQNQHPHEETIADTRFRSLFEYMLEGVAVYRAVDDGDDFVFEDLNQAGQRISQTSKSDVVGRRVTEVFPSVEEMGLLDALRRVWKTGESVVHPITQYEDERISIWVENSVYKLPTGEIVAIYSDETDRMRSLEELENSRQQLDMVLEGSRDGFWDWNVTTGDLFMSPRWHEQLGYEVGDLEPNIETLQTICHPDDYPHVMEVIQLHIDGEAAKQYEVEHRVKTKTGECKWILARGKVYRNDADEAVRMVGTATDISDRKAAEEELARERNLLKTIIDTIPVMITRYDPDANVLYLNREFEEKVGWTTEDVQTVDLMEQVYPDEEYRKRVFEYMQRASTEWKDLRVQTRSGEILQSEWSNVRLDDGTQIGIGIDVTERREMERRLQESKALLDRTGRMARVGGWELDAQTLEVSWTEETYRIHEVPLDYKPPLQEAIKFWHPEDRDRLSSAIDRALKHGEPYDMELRFITANGNHLWAHTICQPEVVNGKTAKLLGTFQDITDLKKAQLQIEGLNAQLEDRVRQRTMELEAANKELESFAYSVSHDLRAPLRAISGFAEIIAERFREELNEQAQRYFDHIIEATGQMSDLIEDLLTYSRLGRKSPQENPVDLSVLFAQLQQNFHDRIEATGADIAVPEGMPEIVTDKTLLYVVLSNIFGNALTYFKPGTEPHIRVAWDKDGNGIRLTIEDDGIGIAEKYHEKVFEIFQRLQSQSKYPGTGIGLGLAKKAADLLGGRIHLDSRLGEGAKFTVEVPGCLE